MSSFRVEHIDHSVSGLIAPLVMEHIKGNKEVGELSHYPLSKEGMDSAMADRGTFQHRTVLVKALKAQNAKIELSEKSRSNIDALLSSNSFCITTGHQLCLLTGPLYFIHKILSTIKFTRQMSARHGQKTFVPIFWMASEDHDLEEVDHFNFNSKRVDWYTEQEGAVGRMQLENIGTTLNSFFNDLGNGEHGTMIREAITDAYRPDRDLASATRHFVNALFGEFGLVIIDGDDVELKRSFAPLMAQEINDRETKGLVEDTVSRKNWRYKIQVNPRSVNLFYLSNGARDRIKYIEEDRFSAAGKSWAKEELLQELNEHPDRFSPNVILRPVYQELVLPNLAYVGGAGELAYWLELKSTFEQFNMKMPVLALRDHVLWIKKKPARKLERSGLQLIDLFRDAGILINEKVIEEKGDEITLVKEAAELQDLFENISKKATRIDPNLERSAAGEEKRAQKSMERLQKKMIRAAKRQNKDQFQRIRDILAVVSPNGSFQERHDNLLDIYLEFGPELFVDLLNACDPLQNQLTVLIENDQ